MTIHLTLTFLIITMSSSLAARQVGEPFVPFEARAYRLINSVAFSPDDGTMLFALFHREVLAHRGLAVDSAPEVSLFSARRTADGWTTPVLLPFAGVFQDYEATWSPDGGLVVFNSRRPYADGRIPEVNDLWMVEHGTDGWGTPTRIAAITTFQHEESYGSLAADRTLVFLGGRSGANGQPTYDLYESRFVDGAFTEAVRHPVSSDRWGEGDPWLARDGSYVIFTRWDEARPWRETVDLYVSGLMKWLA